MATPTHFQQQQSGFLQSQFTGHQFKTLSKSECQIFERLRQFFASEEHTYDDIMKCFYCYVEGVFNQHELFTLITPIITNDDLLNAVKNMVASRDFSRRHHNLLCKPLSEFETHYFKKISYSYFKMPADFPRALCFGRTADRQWAALYKDVFNEEYSSLP